MSLSPEEYKVGYKRPPKHSRWKKGQSGNPNKRRPPREVSDLQAIDTLLLRPIVIVEDGEPCQGTCSGHGHVEAYCSGLAAERVARAALGPAATAHDLVEQRHPALEQIGRHLGAAIAGLVNIFGPDVVVVGGGFGIGAGELLLGPARDVLAVEALRPGGVIPVVGAELGERAGLVGAGLLALEALG